MILTLTLGTFAKGFFTKMGEDAYDTLKSSLATLLTRKRKPVEKETVLQFQFPYDEVDVHASLETGSPVVAKNALTNSMQIIKLLEQAESSGKLPSPATQIDLEYVRTSLPQPQLISFTRDPP